jgi:hypothetical protein
MKFFDRYSTKTFERPKNDITFEPMQQLQAEEGRCMKDFKYLRFLVSKMKWELNTTASVFNFIYSPDVPLNFSIIPRTLPLPSQQELQNSDAVKIGSQYGLLHPSSSRTVLCTVPMDNLNQLDKSRIGIFRFSKASSFTRGAYTSILHGFWLTGANVPRHRGCPYDHFRIRCVIFWHAAFSICPIIYPYKVEVNFNGEKMFRPWKPAYTMNFFANKVPSHSHCTTHYLLNRIQVTGLWVICAMLPLVQVPPPIKTPNAWLTPNTKVTEPYLLNMPPILAYQPLLQ